MALRLWQRLRSNSLAIGLLFLLGFIWGSGYSIAKYATMNGVSPLGYAFWQSLGPAIVVTIVSYARKMPLYLDKRHSVYYLICGLIGIAIPNTTMYFIAPHLPAGLLAVIVNTVPIMTYPIALACRQERFSTLRFVGVACGFIGVAFIVLPHGHVTTMTFNAWSLLALVSPLSFASCAVFIAHSRPKDSTSLSLSAGMLIASTLLLTPMMLANDSFYPLWPPFSLPDWIVLLEIFLSSIGYVLFFQLVKLAGSVYYSLVGGIVALTGLFWGWFIFGEHLNTWNLVATVLILLAIALVTLKQRTVKMA